jgi:hypothetical protein
MCRANCRASECAGDVGATLDADWGPAGSDRMNDKRAVFPSGVLQPGKSAAASDDALELHVVKQLEIAPHLGREVLDEREMVAIQLVGRIVEASRNRVQRLAGLH